MSASDPQRNSLRSLEWLNFFLADVQTGVGPFLAAYLAATGWNPGRVGLALTFGGLVTVAVQTPAGALIDAVHHKRALLASMVAALVLGALALTWKTTTFSVGIGQLLIGGAGAFLGPTVAAITLGIVGKKAFDKQFGRNQGFNAAGNVFTALLLAGISYAIGIRAIFLTAALLAIPTLLSLQCIDGKRIDYARARGAGDSNDDLHTSGLSALAKDRVLLVFLAAAFLFHLANAAMLPELGEMLSHGNARNAAPFMSACIIVTQLVITVSAAWVGTKAATWGRKPLLLVGFGVLPIRGVLYTFTHAATALVSIQILDGVANSIFGIVAILVIADRSRGTGRFNLAQGALATMVGVGAALSNTIGGQLVQRFSYRASFLGLAAIALVALALLGFAVPETLNKDDQTATETFPLGPRKELFAESS
jgi:MFS family permease